jgi:hypothetical protein
MDICLPVFFFFVFVHYLFPFYPFVLLGKDMNHRIIGKQTHEWFLKGSYLRRFYMLPFAAGQTAPENCPVYLYFFTQPTWDFIRSTDSLLHLCYSNTNSISYHQTPAS